MVILRCCWGPSDYQLMLQEQIYNDKILKELDGTYQISVLDDEDVSSFNLNITFNNSTKQVSGFAGCNRFFGSFKLNKVFLEFSDLGSTKMLCTKDKNNIENKLLKAFRKTNTIMFSENGFSIYNKKKKILSATKEEENVNVSFEYSAISRGTYKLIKVNQKSISSTTKQKGKPNKKACDKEDWQKLIKAFKTFEVNNMPNLKAPSEKRLFDGAAIANLKVNYNGKVYESQSFDHGNPPKEIALLVKEILSISENIE